MIPSSFPHLTEIAKILADTIVRIKAAPSQENEKNEPEIEIPLDFYANSSVTVDR